MIAPSRDTRPTRRVGARPVHWATVAMITTVRQEPGWEECFLSGWALLGTQTINSKRHLPVTTPP
jgi:hypothetical protein